MSQLPINGFDDTPPLSPTHPDVLATVDLEWFVKMALRTEPSDMDYSHSMNRISEMKMMRLLHVILGLVTEIGELADPIKKHIYYGKPIDYVNVLEELGDLNWYERIGCDVLDTPMQVMMSTNVHKLKKRFPDRFTELYAQVRDLKGERQILEGGQK